MKAKPNLEAMTHLLQRTQEVAENRRQNHGTDDKPIDPQLEQIHAAELAELKSQLASAESSIVDAGSPPPFSLRDSFDEGMAQGFCAEDVHAFLEKHSDAMMIDGNGAVVPDHKTRLAVYRLQLSYLKIVPISQEEADQRKARPHRSKGKSASREDREIEGLVNSYFDLCASDQVHRIFHAAR